MQTVIFSGSPRKRGNTAYLIDALKAALPGEVTVIDGWRRDIAPCCDCRRCWKQEGCAIDDGMGQVYDLLRQCDNVIIASPVYAASLPGPLLSLLSRTQTYYCARVFRKAAAGLTPKTGAVVLVGGGDGAADGAALTARLLLRQMGCKTLLPPETFLNTNSGDLWDTCPEEAVARMQALALAIAAQGK